MYIHTPGISAKLAGDYHGIKWNEIPWVQNLYLIPLFPILLKIQILKYSMSFIHNIKKYSFKI